jgi:hypothetical protein
MAPLERELQSALLELHRKWGTIGYHAHYFKRMLVCDDPRYVKGPVGTVQHLLAGELSLGSGFKRLVKAGKVDWTVEALLREPKWKPLFMFQSPKKLKLGSGRLPQRGASEFRPMRVMAMCVLSVDNCSSGFGCGKLPRVFLNV